MATSTQQTGTRAIAQRRWTRFLWIGLATIALVLTLSLAPLAAWESHYAVTGRADFNQPQFYPFTQTMPRDRYAPIADWMGRLILPSVTEQGDRDWVWLEVQLAPPDHQDWVGQRVRLEWTDDPAVQQYVQAVTQDVRFTPAVEKSLRETGNLYPVRLNGRSRVGPLQAIAGARPQDDVMVTLPDVVTAETGAGARTVQIASEPVMSTGRYYALVNLLRPATATELPRPTPQSYVPAACPGTSPCPSELFQVQHYNPQTRQFDGVSEIIRIPQQPVDGFGVYASTPRDLARSPAGEAGWYVYGAADATGLFTVQAIVPRSLLQLRPQQVITDKGAGLDFINYDNWKDTEQRKGTLKTTLITPGAPSPEAAIADWREGDRALVMHLFGGRGGERGEGSALGTVTGPFAYGLATVIRDRFTDELRFDLTYQQVYATNIEGIIAATNDWATYMGNLQRGWLGTRPVSDVLVKLDAIAQDYDFGGIPLSPLGELQRQLHLIMARYRTGDGTGAANVTAATSCVQDSNQALFATIQQIRAEVEADPALQQWWSTHPSDPTIQRFERLIALGDDLARQLMPLGIVRQDWESNATALSGTGFQHQTFVRAGDGAANLVTALTSWRTILPRQAQDELSILFLRHGAALWVLHTSQVGGVDPSIVPIAPTAAFAGWTLPGTEVAPIAVLFSRLLGAIAPPTAVGWWLTLGAIAVYAAIALPLGFSQGFLQFQPWDAPPIAYGVSALKLLLLPALVEELLFRVLLLPYPRAGVTGHTWLLWAIASLIAFILYHPLNAKTLFRAGDPTFFDPMFLLLAALLGSVCTGLYFVTGSILPITLVHWFAVMVWLFVLGGMQRLSTASPAWISPNK